MIFWDKVSSSGKSFGKPFGKPYGKRDGDKEKGFSAKKSAGKFQDKKRRKVGPKRASK